ncbi:unnamed protein product, partial [Lymnaea stagnalis]
VAGTILANFTNGVLYFYGNLVAYMDSYFVVACGSKCDDMSSSSILSLYVVFQTIGMLCARPLVAKLGLFASFVSALLLADIGYFLSYFSVQSSVAATVATLGAMAGLGHGAALALSLFYVTVMMPEHAGVLYACVSSSSTLGSVIVNQLITYYINPANEKVDESYGMGIYFSDADVLSHVPSVFLLLGTLSVGFHIAAVVFLKVSSVGNTFQEAQVTKQTNYATFEANNEHERYIEYHAVQLEKPTPEIPECTNESVSSDLPSGAKHNPDYTPVAMLRERRFYIIWASLAALQYGFLQKNNYYKIMAEVWIDDDQFLTTVGTVWPLFVLPSRLLFGRLLDRRITTIKDAIVIALGPNSFFLVLWYFTPSTSRWLYTFWTFCLTVFQSAIYVTYPMTVLKLYGITHYNTNLGLIGTAMMLASLISPTLNEVLLQSGGWFWLFFT